jgi:hypothetical protein
VQADNSQQPVAYDREGRPLYAAAGEQPNLVYMAKAIDPIQQPISQRVMDRHKESLKLYPFLNLSKGEYVISAVRRHPIGLLRIWFFAVVLVAALVALFAVMFSGPNAAAQGIFQNGEAVATAAAVGLGMMSILIVGGAMIATYVYEQNKFFLTNESVIQEIQTSLFSSSQQTVSLANIEDASYQQHGIIPSLFNYAGIRLSTEGDETTYRFSYVSNPKRQIAILNNAVEAFKNGRPVDPDES